MSFVLLVVTCVMCPGHVMLLKQWIL